MTHRILLFSCEPGGAEVLAPVAEFLEKHPDYEPILVSYGLGLERFRRYGLKVQQIDPVTPETSLLADCRPDFLITSAASLPDRDGSEHELWRQARELGIPTLAFLDQWQNYGARFSSPGHKLDCQPDYINCIDQIAFCEMVASGFDPKKLVLFGHPYLSKLPEFLGKTDRTAIMRRLGFGQKPVHLFVTEAIEQHYGRSRGYHQYDAFELFLEHADSEASLLVKIHPKDSQERYQELADAAGRPIVMVGNELTPIECLSCSDRVYGMTSLMLIEAYLLQKEVYSLQPGLTGRDELVLSRQGMIPLLGSKHPIQPVAHSVQLEPHFKVDHFARFLAQVLNRAARL